MRRLLLGIDAGLASARPIGPSRSPNGARCSGPASAPQMPAQAARTALKGRLGLLIGAAAAAVLALAGGGYYFVTSQPSALAVAGIPAVSAEKVAQEQAELARLRAESAARAKAEQEAALQPGRRGIQRRIVAETAEKKRLEEEAKQKADAEVAAKRKAEEDDARPSKRRERRCNWEGSTAGVSRGWRWSPWGSRPSLLDGTLDPGSSKLITAWQKQTSWRQDFSPNRSIKPCCRKRRRPYPNSTTSRRIEGKKQGGSGKGIGESQMVPLEDDKSPCIWQAGRNATRPQTTSPGSSPIGWTFSYAAVGRHSRPTRPAILPEAFQASRTANSRCW